MFSGIMNKSNNGNVSVLCCKLMQKQPLLISLPAQVFSRSWISTKLVCFALFQYILEVQ